MKKQKIWMFQFFLLGFFFLFFGRVIYLNVWNHEKFLFEKDRKTKIVFDGGSAPRGRILDVNGKVLVDNIGVHDIVYHKDSSVPFLEEVDIAKKILELSDFPVASEAELKDFFILSYPLESRALITPNEMDDLQKRKVSSNELQLWMRERITPERLEVFNDDDKKIAHIYALMNEGYIYQNKTLLSDVSDDAVAKIMEEDIPGIFSEVNWKRNYPYGTTLRNVFGNLSDGLPFEKADEFLKQGYSYDDIVGISSLEMQYESFLKGEKAKYLVQNDRTLTVLKEAFRGKDLVLSIDIDLQLAVEHMMKETFLNVLKLPNTEYLKESYVLIGNPLDGSIMALVGEMALKNGKVVEFQDVSTNNMHSAFTVGSIVKGASHTVGYLNNAIELDKKIKDSCVKLYSVPQKCSYKELGYLDDISALKMSSNYYQFLTAIRITGKPYSYNMKLNATKDDFLKYRSVFQNYGLGSLTGIDLPGEQIGIIGKTISDDLLLNLTIGQYDTYTPLELLQYINTIQNNGNRFSLSLMQSIKDMNGDIVKQREPESLSHLSLDQKYYDRIKEGLRQVLYNGTGSGYVNNKYNAYGKTGTAESFYDKNQDGIVDTKTISSTFAMVAPLDSPKYSLVIVTPNISHYDGLKDYTAPFNRLLSNKITNYLFS